MNRNNNIATNKNFPSLEEFHSIVDAVRIKNCSQGVNKAPEHISLSDNNNVAIIILNYNNKKSTIKCLKSLENLTYPKERLYVIIVENSTIKEELLTTQEILQCNSQYRIDLIVSSENCGFAGGVNIGAQMAFGKINADFILLLNNDAIIPKSNSNLIEVMVKTTKENLNVAAVGPKIYYSNHPKGSNVIWTAGASFYDKPKEVDQVDEDLHGLYPCDFIAGACMFISKVAWTKVGPMDSRFFAYYEEIEWSIRAFEAGLQSYCIRDSYIYHSDYDNETSKRNSNPFLAKISARNQVLLTAKHIDHINTVYNRLKSKYDGLVVNTKIESATAMIEGIDDAYNDRFYYGEPQFTYTNIK